MTSIPSELLNTTFPAAANHTTGFMVYDDFYNWTDPMMDPGGPMEGPMGGPPGGPPFGPPPPPAPDIVMLQTIVRGLQLYLSPILACCGLAGNVLCLLCLAMSSAKSSGKCFGTALIAAESLQLLTLLQDWATEMGLDLYVVSGWCHLKMFLADGSKFLSTWYLVCGVVSCLLSNCFPDRDCCSQWRHLVLTLVLAILALVVYLNISLTATLLYVSYHPVCMYMRTPDSPLIYLNHVDTFMNILIPVLLNSICGVCLCLVKCCCIDRSNRDIDAQVIDHRFILFHTVLWMPFEITRLHNGLAVLSSNLAPNVQLRNFLWKELFKYVSYLNMAVTFLVLIVANTMFRKQLKEKACKLYNKLCAPCYKRRNGSYLSYTSAAAQTSFIEPNIMAVETI